MIDNIVNTLVEMFSFTFLVRAVIVGALVSVCAALLGVSLVLKRYSMIGDGLSHVGFGALAVATACNAAPLAVAIPIVVAAAFLLLRLGEKHLLKGDAAIALLSTSSLAIGVVIISQTTGMNTDVCNYLFGSILAMNKNDVYMSIALSAVVLTLYALFYHKLFAITFDETFARTSGVKTGLLNMLIAFLTALIITLGMRIMGTMLISALIIFPALTSMRLFKTFRSVSVSAVCVSIICFFAGIIISYVYAVPTGASVVLINICAFALFWLINTLKKEKIFMKKTVMKQSALLVVLLAALVVSCGKTRTQSNFSAITAAPSGSASVTPPPVKPAAVNKTQAASASAVVSAKPATNVPAIEIKEKMFIAQANDVYLNPKEYLGKTIRLEGLFKQESGYTSDYCFVVRYGPGCCGSDGNVGFEVAWSKTASPGKTYPKPDEWVEATGVLKTYTENDYPYLYLELVNLDVKEQRGSEFVTQ